MNAYIALKSLFEVSTRKKQVSLMGRFKFYLWCTFLVKKTSHQRRIKQASRLLRLFNQQDFRHQPTSFFAYLRKIDAFTFEELLLLAFKARGCKVIHNEAYTGDGGIDGMVIFPDKTRWAIQAKRYSTYIKLEHVKALSQVVKAQRLQGGIFIHTGQTGGRVYPYLGKEILLISGQRLHQFVTSALG